MKICYLFCCVMLFTLSCTLSNKSIDDSLIKVDLHQNFQEKEVKLDDIATINYINLEVNDEYLFNGSPRYITDNTVVIHDMSNGNFLFFLKNGKPKSKFNHKGNGPGEYTFCYSILYDEKRDELFVKTEKKIIVYSSLGEYKRSFSLPEEESILQIVNYDDVSLLLYEANCKYPTPFVLISKEDGSIVETIKLFQGEKVELNIWRQVGESVFSVIGPKNNIARYNDGFLLTEYSNDTVYFYDQKKILHPILVRSPSIHTMDPIVYMNSFVEVGDFQFIRMITVKNENSKLPSTYLVRDKKDGSIYKQKIIINDFKGKQFYISPETISKTNNSKIGFIELDSEELIIAYDNNKLDGQLKSLVKIMSESGDGNNIYMLIEFK